MRSPSETKPTAGLGKFGIGAVTAVLICAPAIVKLAFYPAYPGSDDAFIHIAVAENVIHGSGWGVASNGRVNLSSSPLFTVLLLPILALGSVGLAQFFSVAFSCLALAVTYFTTRIVTSSQICALAALIVAASNIHLWRWTGTVMETTLAYLIVTVVGTLMLQLLRASPSRMRMFATLGVVVGLGTMVRFEIGLLLPLSIAVLWVGRSVRPAQVAGVLAGFAAAVSPWVIFATTYFGSPIPTTFYAKTANFRIANVTVIREIGTVAATGAGVSILVASIAIGLAWSSSKGRAALQRSAMALVFLIAWPVSLFVFYYLKTAGLQSAGRYFLPGMATWPMAVGLIIAAVPGKNRNRSGLTAALLAGLIAGLVVNLTVTTPVLSGFNDGYRAATLRGAEFLRDNCRPGDIALIDVDIGIMAREGIGNCVLVDGGALATPTMRGLTVPEKLSRSGATYLVQSTGRSAGEFTVRYPQLELVFSQGYSDHGIANRNQFNYLSIYSVGGS